ncbi:MAG: hypothetical protein J5972_05775, partial [Eubacterium sp.]|nr:hypothetical protein [Eubacterium sp.]
NITVTKSDVTEAGYDYDEFLSDVNNATKMADMQTKYPKLFKKATADKTDTDEEGTYKKNGIRNIAINDEQNWVRSDNLGDTFEFTMDNEFTSTELGITDINNVDAPEVVKNNETLFKSKLWDDKKKAAVEDYANWSCTLESTTTEDLYVENTQSGYFYYTSDNSGDYDFEANYHVASLGKAAFIAKPTTNGHWKYVETLDQIPEGKTEKTSMTMNDDVDKGWNGVANCYVSCDTIRSGLNFVISKTLDVGHYKFSYKYVPQLEEEPTFKFKYWSIKHEDVLKRSLFVFDNEEQCENFNLQVVCMTPSQINKLAQKDTDEKVDIIERADLFYISTIDKNITNYDKVIKFYNEHVNKTGEDVDVNNLKSFANDDLEWDLCMKLLKRCSDNPNLPLMYNKPVGLLLDEYADESIDMYVGEHQNGDTKAYSSTINNIGKMYLMSLQFDLQAGTQSSESKIEYQQTLFGDNGLANKIHTVKLSKEITDKMEPDSAKYTGWFEPAVIKNEKSKYLWNRYTFYPGGVPNGSSIDTYMQYGYLKTYLKTYPFEKDNDTNESKYEHLEGTDGDVDDNNVTVVRSGSLADTNRSTMISLTEGSDIVNTMMKILFKIMNNGKDPEAGNLNLAVRSHKKYYTRISDNSVLLDYTLDAKYTNASEKIIYLKVSIANPTGEMKNLEPGSVNSVALVNDSGDEIAVDVYDTIGGDPKEKEEIYDEIFDKTDTTHFLYGYRVPLENPLVIYVPFTLEQWQEGYHSVEFKLQGMTYNAKKKVCVLGTETTETVDIGERPLFNLE